MKPVMLTLSGQQIGQVKEKISKEKGWEVSQQKHIYSGMLLWY
jgi:hypothetical protein